MNKNSEKLVNKSLICRCVSCNQPFYYGRVHNGNTWRMEPDFAFTQRDERNVIAKILVETKMVSSKIYEVIEKLNARSTLAPFRSDEWNAICQNCWDAAKDKYDCEELGHAWIHYRCEDYCHQMIKECLVCNYGGECSCSIGELEGF
jgi:hypothetical protein